jgi:hypothetical protein
VPSGPGPNKPLNPGSGATQVFVQSATRLRLCFRLHSDGQLRSVMFLPMSRKRAVPVAVLADIPALSCRSCWPNAPFAELVYLSKLAVKQPYKKPASASPAYMTLP